MFCGCLWPASGFGDNLLSAEVSQEREYLVGAFVQHLAFWGCSFSAEGSQERECLVNAFVQHPALGMKSCLQRVRESVNVLLVPCPCAASGSGDEILSAEGSQERGCLVSAFTQPRVVAE